MTARSILDAADRLRLTLQKFCVVPEVGAAHHQVSVVIRESLGDPKTTRVGRSREIPWSKSLRAQSLHVPDVKELVRDGVQRVLVHAGIGERARFDDLS